MIRPLFFFLFVATLSAQNNCYWQQHVDYVMDVDMDLKKHQYRGTQKLTYTNHSPDTLNKVYYHLYFNAFQPGSEMDQRLQEMKDPDARMVHNIGTKENPIYESRIALLQPDEIGFLKVLSLEQDGVPLTYHTEGTLLVVTLNQAIFPGEMTVFDMTFLGQIPQQIRRSGRNNKEGVALSMTQWYPKLAEYDFEGWHTHAYIAREFHGVWGDFDVTLHLDKKYVVGGTGYLQNPQAVGHGYEDKAQKMIYPKGKKLTWHFLAPKVHDFTWAADPKFHHDILDTESGTRLHFFYKKNLKKKYLKNWEALPSKTSELLAYYNSHVGPYPYKQYSVIQGGDGGMEYGMCTLVTGERSFGSLVGVVAHELAHSWFQFVLATNESKHPWMDEGFTTYVSNYAENHVLKLGNPNPNSDSYKSYFQLWDYHIEEPLTTQSDAYHYNYAYSVGSYSKGALFLAQLEYVLGKENVDKTLQRYYQKFQFKHPSPNDIKRTAEKVSGISLDWYLNYWTQTTHAIDYGVSLESPTQILLQRIGRMPMPIDLSVVYRDGTTENFYIPLLMMRGEKPTMATRLKDWSWVAPQYRIATEKKIDSVVIDPLEMMADVDRSNNSWSSAQQIKKQKDKN